MNETMPTRDELRSSRYSRPAADSRSAEVEAHRSKIGATLDLLREQRAVDDAELDRFIRLVAEMFPRLAEPHMRGPVRVAFDQLRGLAPMRPGAPVAPAVAAVGRDAGGRFKRRG